MVLVDFHILFLYISVKELTGSLGCLSVFSQANSILLTVITYLLDIDRSISGHSQVICNQ